MKKYMSKLKYLLVVIPLVLLMVGLLGSPYKAMADSNTVATLCMLADVSQSDIDNKKAERDRARSEAAGYESQASELRTEKGNLQGSQESSPTPQFKSINSSALSFPYSPTLTSICDYWKNHSLD